MNDILTTLFSILKQDERLVAEDGTLLRNRAYELSLKMDKRLIKALLDNGETQKFFFTLNCNSKLNTLVKCQQTQAA